MGIEILPEFRVHRLNEQGMARATELAEQFSKLLSYIEGVSEAGRELSIVKTKLEEACFFAKKAIASRTTNQAA